MRRMAIPAARTVKTQKGTGRAMVASPRNFSRWASIASCRNSWRDMGALDCNRPPILAREIARRARFNGAEDLRLERARPLYAESLHVVDVDRTQVIEGLGVLHQHADRADAQFVAPLDEPCQPRLCHGLARDFPGERPVDLDERYAEGGRQLERAFLAGEPAQCELHPRSLQRSDQVRHGLAIRKRIRGHDLERDRRGRHAQLLHTFEDVVAESQVLAANSVDREIDAATRHAAPAGVQVVPPPEKATDDPTIQDMHEAFFLEDRQEGSGRQEIRLFFLVADEDLAE